MYPWYIYPGISTSPAPPKDSIRALMVVWRLEGENNLCAMIHTHTCEQFLNLYVGLDLDFFIVYLD